MSINLPYKKKKNIQQYTKKQKQNIYIQTMNAYYKRMTFNNLQINVQTHDVQCSPYSYIWLHTRMHVDLRWIVDIKELHCRGDTTKNQPPEIHPPLQ